MPETTHRETEDENLARNVSEYAAEARTFGERLSEATRLRNGAMLASRVRGFSLGQLATLSGLSVAQVQRICDLSKDRGTG